MSYSIDKKTYVLTTGVYLTLYGMTGFVFPFWISLALWLLCFAFFLFIEKLATNVAFRELALFTACLQLLGGSLVAFYLVDPDPVFLPSGSPEDYFALALPGVAFFGIGLFFTNSKVSDKAFIETAKNRYQLDRIATKLIIIGLASVPLQLVVSGSLGYFFTILTFLAFCGGFMMVFSNHPGKTLWIVAAFLPTVLNALSGAVFYMALIWGAFLFLYLIMKWHLTTLQKVSIVLGGIFIIMLLDTSKIAYRQMVLRGGEYSNQSTWAKFGALADIFTENLTSDQLGEDENLSGRTTRINQGAIVTWVMDHVPERQPFAQGQTIYRAVESALLPRFLAPNKMEAGGKENYERFTGKLLMGTSINISLLGEGYANFGNTGAVIFMFAVGWMYAFIYKKITQKSMEEPIFIFFIPFLLIYAIKAEDDLMTPLNHLIKAAIVFYFFNKFYFKKLIRKHTIRIAETDFA